MRPCKRHRPSPPPREGGPHDRSEYDERPTSRHVAKSQSCIPHRHAEGIIARGNNPDPRHVTRQWNHDSHRQDLNITLQSRSWDIRNSLEVVEPRFPPGFEPSVNNTSPSCKNVRGDQDGTPPKIDHVEGGEFMSTVQKQRRSAVSGCVQQEDYEDDGDDDEIPPLRVREEFKNGIGGPQVETTKCNFKGDDNETPLRVTEGLTKDVQGAELQVEITNCEDLIKVEGDDKNIPPATHEVPAIDENHMAVNTITPQVKNGTPYHQVRENLSEDEVLVNANAISTPSSDVFNPMGNAETVKEIIEVWRQYTCARMRHEEVKREEEKHVQKLDHLMSLLVKDHMNAKENE